MTLMKLENEEILSPRESGLFIAQNCDGLLKIDEESLENVAQMIYKSSLCGELDDSLFDAQELHIKSTNQKAIDWIFFIDVINFSFWSENESSFTVTTVNANNEFMEQTGYFAACACLNKALKNGIPLTDANFMSSVTESQLAEIFKSDSGNAIPLLKDRVKVIQEAGKVLLEKFDGTFYNCVKKCNKSAKNLLELIVENFDSFRDFAEFKGKKVSFLKRAQILVSDVYGCLGTTDPIADFLDISCLTMFADYRVPQALAFLNVFKYSDGLLKSLKSDQLLVNESIEEVVLRGCSIYACNKITEKIEQIRNEGSFEGSTQQTAKPIHAIDVDMFLWSYRRKYAEEIKKSEIPFHKVRCIYY